MKFCLMLLLLQSHRLLPRQAQPRVVMFSPPLHLTTVPREALKSGGWACARRVICAHDTTATSTLTQLGFSKNDILVCSGVGMLSLSW